MNTPPFNAVSPTKLYSSINVPESPLSSQQGQLTGLPRRVRDSVADLFNSVQEWNRLHVDGMSVIHQIKDKKLDGIEKKDDTRKFYPEGLQDLCDKLDTICRELNMVSMKMKNILKNFEAIKQLEEMKRLMKPIFITWTAEKYVITATSIFESYEQEALLKMYVKENLAHAITKEEIMLYCALWAHQPYIESDLDFMLEAMLKETGHR